MPFRLTQGFSKRPSVGRILLLAAAVLFAFVTGAVSVTAQTADDHGDDTNNATNLPLGSSVAGRIDPGDDRDVFKLDLSGTSGTTDVWIYTTGELDTLGELYDSNGSLLTSDDDTTSGSEVIDTNFRIPRPLAPGVYYVSVQSAVRVATGDYTLHVKADDHGHYLDTATTLLLGDSAAGRIDPGFDRDVFKLDLSGTSGTTDVWIYTTGELDTWGWLYDSNGDLLTSNDDATSGSEVIDTNFRIPRPLAPGVYYVLVHSAVRMATGDYTLHAKADDHGQSFDTATTLLLGDSAAGRIDPGFDLDLFKLDLSGTSGTTDVWIYTTGELDTLGELYDSNGSLLTSDDDSYIVGREYGFNLRRNLSSGVYYLSVRSWAGAIGPYTLHAEAVTDPGNTTGTATTLNLNPPTPGMIDTAGDSDYFRLVLAESKNLVVYALSSGFYDRTLNLLLREPLHGTVLDDTGADISVNVNDNVNNKDIGFEIKDDFDPGTYYVKVTAPASDTTYPVPYTIHAYEDAEYTNWIEGCEAATAALNNPQINDSLYGCQWHLNNREGQDINVEAVWTEGIDGEGVNIAVVDDTVDYGHEDLAGNIDSSLNHDYGGMGGAYRPFDHHGTAVAGIIAARDNGTGVRGVAPRATVYGYNLLADGERHATDLNKAAAMSRKRNVTAVSNNSWGPVDGPWLGLANQPWELSIDKGIQEGYEGKGVFYVFAGGNGGRGHPENPDGTLVGGYVYNVIGRGDNSNLDELANYYAVTAVCAVNDADVRSVYSEKGANLWVCAPSGDYGEHRGIVTTENSDRYRSSFGGTSAAAPIVSGVAALLRQANPDLTWRDLKLILAASARKNDAANSGWVEGARKYGAGSATDRYHFNHEYGFGVVDAKAAVDIARGWTNVPPLERVSAASEAEVAIPPPSGSIPQTVTTTLTLNTGIRFTEFVEVNTDFEHTSFRDMDIELVSPSGAVSKLTVPFNTRHYTDPDGSTFDAPYLVRLKGEFRFGSARHLGEDPSGQWTLRLTDHFPEFEGTLRSWSIKVYGHASDESAASPDLVVDTPSVSDSAPEAGASFTLSATVRNQGSGSSASTTLRYYRSTDSVITSSDTPFGTNSVSGLSAAGTSPESVNLTAPSTPGTYYYGACVDAVSNESDTTNNCSSAVIVTVGAAPAPDLVVDTPSVSDSAPEAGASFTLSATVRNQGSGSSASTTLRYYRSTDSVITSSDTPFGTNSVSGLSAAGTSPESVNLTAPSTPGTYYYGACVDAVSNESDTTNNCSSAVIVTVGAAPAPDLVVDTPSVSDSAPEAGASFTLSATVRNQGSGSSASTTLRYYRSTDSVITSSDTPFGTNSVSGLSAAGTSPESVNLTAPSTPGTYYYGACVDAVSNESDTTNNCSSAVIVTVGAAPAPDLVVDTPSVSDSAPEAGASFTLSATVRNQGSGSSASTTLRYYRSTDSVITSSDTPFGTNSVSGLSAAGTSPESVNLTAPSTPGTYYYGACVDAVSNESDTTNNCSSAVIVTVGGAPATMRATRSFPPPSAAPGGVVVVTITASGYGGFGRVVETLPPGFSYVSSSLSDDLVTVNGQEVIFTLLGETDFTYRVTAPGAAGHYSFSGVLTNSDREEVPVGGALTITVGALPSVIVSRAAGIADTPVRPGSPVSLTATFSGPVSGFASDDINVINGTVSNFAGTGAVYTFDVAPDDIGEVTVDIAAGVAQDADGNGNEAAPRFYLGITYDDDGDGTVSRAEAIAAIRDYFGGNITRAQAIAVIRLYFSGAG